MLIVCLHGFLGRGADWRPVTRLLDPGAALWQPDLLSPGPLSPELSIEAWTQRFLSQLEPKARGHERVVLCGYSMGGRLALHALRAAPHRFTLALIASARPRLEVSAMASRRAWERRWAARFLADPWPDVIEAWNALPVFQGGGAPPARRAGDFDRALLAAALERWSPREHSPELTIPGALPAYILWAYGERDQRYAAIARQLASGPEPAKVMTIKGAGHRLLSDAPKALARALIAHARSLDSAW
jgi:2-succinyl-6-hydroxy-2,4-cyclohexadiene-1-carboxylate synthase